MLDVDSSLSTTTEEFWIENENTSIDIGLINFDVVRLSGNMPVTINNKPLEDYDDYTVGYMNIFDQNGGLIINGLRYPSWSVRITPNGDWFLNIAKPDSEIPLGFQVEVRQNDGFLKKTLNTGNAVTIYDTDKEFVFPDYPSVNLEAFLLSGTIEVVAPGTGESRYYSIKFFREYPESIGYGPEILLCDTTTGWSKSGRKAWKTTIPVLELPHELLYSFTFVKKGKVYEGNSSVVITGDTDLSNINLGVFTFK